MGIRPVDTIQEQLKPLTRNQYAIFTFCREFLAENQAFPSIRVISAAFNFHSQNGASGHLSALVKKGYIEKWRHEYHDSVKNKKSTAKGYRICELAKNVSFDTIMLDEES